MSETSIVPEPAPVTGAVADPVATKLAEFGLTEVQIQNVKNLGVESLDDCSSIVESDLTALGIPPVKARKIIAAFKAVPAPVVASAPVSTPVTAVNFDSILPSVPDETSWLSSLRAEGVLRVSPSTVIAAIRAALADRFGLYDVTKKILTAMERYVDETEEQVTSEYWAIRKQLTRKSYGDLFEAIDGLDASFVTETRKQELLSKINENVWPAIIGFNDALASWQESWVQGSNNPGMMMNMMAMMAGGGAAGGMLPPGAMSPPDCGVLRDAAESVNTSLNRAFRGTGVQISAALAYEANQIKAVIENSRIPMMCGVANRELLLKKLGVAVPATYPRMEQNLTRFVTSILGVESVAAGNEELRYFSSLYMLGTQIPWNDLNRGVTPSRPSTIGNTMRRSRPVSEYQSKVSD